MGAARPGVCCCQAKKQKLPSESAASTSIPSSRRRPRGRPPRAETSSCRRGKEESGHAFRRPLHECDPPVLPGHAHREQRGLRLAGGVEVQPHANQDAPGQETAAVEGAKAARRIRSFQRQARARERDVHVEMLRQLEPVRLNPLKRVSSQTSCVAPPAQGRPPSSGRPATSETRSARSRARRPLPAPRAGDALVDGGAVARRARRRQLLRSATSCPRPRPRRQRGSRSSASAARSWWSRSGNGPRSSSKKRGRLRDPKARVAVRAGRSQASRTPSATSASRKRARAWLSRDATVPRRMPRARSPPTRNRGRAVRRAARRRGPAPRAWRRPGADVEPLVTLLGLRVERLHVGCRRLGPAPGAPQLVEAAAEDDAREPGRLVRLVREAPRQPPIRL